MVHIIHANSEVIDRQTNENHAIIWDHKCNADAPHAARAGDCYRLLLEKMCPVQTPNSAAADNHRRSEIAYVVHGFNSSACKTHQTQD